LQQFQTLQYLLHGSFVQLYPPFYVLLLTSKITRSERRWLHRDNCKLQLKAKHWIEVVELNKSTATIAKKDARKRGRETKNSKA
jgi:hypothetical protein